LTIGANLATFGPVGTCGWLAEDTWAVANRAPTASDLCGQPASYYVEIQSEVRGTILTHLCDRHEAIVRRDGAWRWSRPLDQPVGLDLLAEAGLPAHVRLRITPTAWADCVTWTDADTTTSGMPQDEDGRLWDLVWMTSVAYRRGVRDGDRMDVLIHRWPSAASVQTAEPGPPLDEDEDPEPPLVRLVGRMERDGDLAIVVLDTPRIGEFE